MKLILIAIIASSVLCCKQSDKSSFSDLKKTVKTEDTIAIRNVEVLKADLVLNPLEGIWYYKEQAYNGYAVNYYSNDNLKEKLGFFQGKRQGLARTWSEKGALRTKCFYNQNKLSGVYKSFWENGNLDLEVNYVDGKKQGEEKQWYSNGEISKIRLFKDGNEDGLQKAWLPNGKLYVNYEAKNGRIFGLMRANSCYKLENEKVVKVN